MPNYTVMQLKNQLGSGAKADRFAITFGAPTIDTSIALGNDDILCKATEFPSVSVGEMVAWIQGRRLLLPGNIEYTNSWTLTFYQTEGHELRQKFIKWVNYIDSYINNTHICDPASVMVEAHVAQLGCSGSSNNNTESARYTFFNMFPKTVSEVSVDGESVNTLQTFQVTFAFSHWDIGTPAK